jgi:hypothetical protein
MGWAGGSSIMSELIDAIKPIVKRRDDRMTIYQAMIETFEDSDCDTLDECIGQDPAWDAVYKKKYPDYFDDSDE